MHKAILLVGLVTIGLSAQTLTTIANFNGINGAGPVGGLILAADGNFYGMTGGGGSGYGLVYQLTPSGTLTTLYKFQANDGGFPAAGLIQASDGSFYGTAGESRGNYGGVFKITSSGILTTLYTFSATGCYAPNGPLIQATDGSLYGTTTYGGSGGCIFRITTAGTLTVLHSFGLYDGGGPQGLVQGSDGSFYGVTAVGGTDNAGTVFKITPAGSLTTLYNFSGSDGSGPTGALVAAADGNLYGSTSAGGSSGNGTVFKITPGGALTTIHSFSSAEGYGPQGTLLRASDGNFYGTTKYGAGFNTYGTIFKVTPSGALTTIHNFTLGDGTQPAGQLIQGSDGNIYGSTSDGGKYGGGVLFKLTIGGAVQPPTVATSPATSVTDSSATLGASVTANGADTQAWFTYGTDSSLAGAVSSPHLGVGSSPFAVTNTLSVSRLSAITTYYFQAFASNSAGTSSSPITSFTTAGLPVYSISGTVSFAGKGLAGVNVVLDGSGGQSGPTNGSGDYFFEPGAGGNYTVTPVASGYTFVPASVSFSNLNSDQVANFTALVSAPMPALTTLVSFNGTNGATPAGLVQARDGNLYGSTSAGGVNSQGTIFRLTTAGGLTTMHSFSGSDGITPGGAPVQASDGNLYGITTSGGTGGAGTAYQLDLSGGFTAIANFGIENGPSSGESLIQAADGNLYGTTVGGFIGPPSVFRMTRAGVLTILDTFAVGGNGPYAGLLQATDGNFYGTLYGGGGIASQPGLVFKMTPSGSVTAFYIFCTQANCADGETPETALIQGADGNIYGTTEQGGSDRGGVAFRLTPAGVQTVLHSFSLADGGGPSALLQAIDGNFYGTTSGGGAGYGGTIFQLTPAGVFTTLHNFSTTDGANPRGPLIQAADGSLYGVTATGGAYGNGTIFRLALPQVAPIVNPSSGVVSAASFQPGIAANSWVTILGSNLSPQTDTWSNWIVNGVLPQSLDGVSVKVGSQFAYVAYISPEQINVLVPDIPPGNVAITVSNGIGASTPVTATAQTLQPAFFQWGQYAVATRTDYSDAVKNGTIPGVSTLPAKPGDTIVLWGTGFGPTTPPLPQGVTVPSSTTYNTANPVKITIGGAPAAVFGVALTSGAAGLYQVAIQIPASLSDGDYPVVASISGVQSPTGVLITVQH